MSFRVIKDEDKGFKAFFRGLRGLAGKRARVGIQGAEAAEILPGGISMVGLASIHEFGAPNANIPQRSFLRSTADENRARYEKRLARIAKNLLDQPMRFNADGDFLKLGESVRRDVIKKIQSNIPPPLAGKTVARKKGDTQALVDTGQMLGSIRAVVV